VVKKALPFTKRDINDEKGKRRGKRMEGKTIECQEITKDRRANVPRMLLLVKNWKKKCPTEENRGD